MMIIRKTQLETLNEHVRRAFELSSSKYLIEKYPNETREKNKQEMIQFVRSGIDKAVWYKIVERNDILSFLEYMICYGQDFETNPANEWATKVFRIGNLKGDERIIRLMENKPLKSIMI